MEIGQMNAQKIGKILALWGLGVLGALCITAQASFAISTTPQVIQGEIDAQLQQILNDLDAQEIIAIDVISRSYRAQRTVLEQKLRSVQSDFNQQLRFISEETAIREAFVPVARALEDMAINEVMMMKEINSVLTAHKHKKTLEHADLAKGDLHAH